MKLTSLLAFLFLLVAGPAVAQTNPVTTYVGPASTTYTKTDVTLTGSSQTMLAASATRRVVTVYNSVTNASVYVELSGGAAVSDAATQVPAGSTLVIAGSVVPLTAITIIGTAGQHVFVQDGQ